MKSYVGQNCVLECLSTPRAWRRNKIDAPKDVNELSTRECVSLLSWLVASADIIARAQRLTPDENLPQPEVGKEIDWLLSTPTVEAILDRLSLCQYRAKAAENRRLLGLAPSEADGSPR